MEYTIGEFAAMLGVTTDTLRLYEKHGIIKPSKDNKNNYRYFTDLDARNLLMSRWYRSMGISLQEVALLTKDASLDYIIEKMNETQIALEEDIQKRKMLLDKVTQINDNFSSIKNSLYQCSIKQISGIYRLKQTNGDNLLKDKFLTCMVNTWMERLPYTYYSFRIEKDELYCEKDSFEYSWGLAISEDELSKVDLEINENVEYTPPGRYVSSTILASDKEFIFRNSIQFIIDYIVQNQYTIKGDIIGKMMLTEKSAGYNRSYLEVNIPI